MGGKELINIGMWFWKTTKGRVVQKTNKQSNSWSVTLLLFKWETRSGDGGRRKVSWLSLQTPFANWLSRLPHRVKCELWQRGVTPWPPGRRPPLAAVQEGDSVYTVNLSLCCANAAQSSSQLLQEGRTCAHARVCNATSCTDAEDALRSTTMIHAIV